MKKLRNAMLAFLSAAALCSLAGCSKTQVSQDDSKPEYTYVPAYTEFGKELDLYVENVLIHGEQVYFSSYGLLAGAEEDDYGTSLYTMQIDGTNIHRLEEYQAKDAPEGMNGGGSLQALSAASDGTLWLLERYNTYSYTEEGAYQEGEEDFFLRHVDANGALLSEFSLSDLDDGAVEEDSFGFSRGFYINSFAVDAQNNIALLSNSTIYLLDSEGASKGKIETDRYFDSLIPLSDGTIAAFYYKDRGYVLSPIDFAAAKFSDQTYTLPNTSRTAYAGSGDYLFYFSDDNDLYGFKTESNENELLLNWINCDVLADYVVGFGRTGDGQLTLITTEYSGGRYNGEPVNYVVTLTKTPTSEVQEKTTLKMVSVGLNQDVRSQLVRFNRTNGTYRIELEDYSKYAGDGSDAMASIQTHLNNEIAAGRTPDIIDTSFFSVESYIRKGLFADILPMLEADSTLSRNDLMDCYVNSISVNGKLYLVSPFFTYQTLAGPRSLWGDTSGWTWNDVAEFQKQNPDKILFPTSYSRSDFFRNIFPYSMDTYIDFDSSTCNFNQSSFLDLLNYAKTFPTQEEIDSRDYSYYYDDILSGAQVLDEASFYSFDSIDTLTTLFGDRLSYVGYPSENGTGSMILCTSGFAICEKSAHKDGAWSFLRTLLSEDFQGTNTYGWGLPTNKAAFNAAKQQYLDSISYDENGNPISTSGIGWGDSGMLDIYPAGEEDLEDFIAALNRVSKGVHYDNAMLDMIMEDVEQFFAGSSTAENTASVIQSRLSTYLSEQS